MTNLGSLSFTHCAYCGLLSVWLRTGVRKVVLWWQKLCGLRDGQAELLSPLSKEDPYHCRMHNNASNCRIQQNDPKIPQSCPSAKQPSTNSDVDVCFSFEKPTSRQKPKNGKVANTPLACPAALGHWYQKQLGYGN